MNPDGGPKDVRAEQPEADAQFQRLFAAVGKREQPSDAQLERWQHGFVTELAAQRRRVRTRRVAAGALACAAALVIAVGVRLSTPAAPDAAAVAEVVAAFGGNVARRGEQLRSLQAGSDVLEGERVESGLRSGLALRYRNADVRVAADTSVTFRPAVIELQHGAVYVDTGTSGLPPGALQVRTALGSISHRGTQFMVEVTDGRLLAAVREGAIVVQNQAQTVDATASPGTATLIELGVAGEITRSAVPACGDLWSWTLAAAPGMTLAGHSADELLRWAARERCQILQYSTDQAARLAASAPIAGASGTVQPGQAIKLVSAATGLRVTGSPPEPLTVEIASEADQDPD